MPTNRDGEQESAHQRENASASAAAIAEIRRLGNHLKGQPSPYLEQHAHNPVDWYPWGDEALSKAKRENKPIFLSVGYSTCHWCHVMAHESFEDDEVAAFLNEHFVSIKVDREQRPDIDALYIDSVRAMGGSTGWPLTVFLTPKLEPFFGGTYYPRHSKHGRPGFLEVLDTVRVMYADEGDKIAKRGQQVLKQIERQALSAVQLAGVPDRAVLSAAMVTLARRRDPNTGGFGNRQKFPNTPLLIAELRHIKRSEDPATKGHLVLTLDEMLRGGIRDHLDGSFHRYAVDTRWHIPHFEKMLYDNGQLAGLYIEAGLFLEREDYVLAGRQVLDDLIAKWRGAGNAFIVGFDADDPVGEGAYYSWTPAELDSALGTADGQSMAAIFGVSARGDRELEGRSVLHRQPGVVPKDGGSTEDLFARAMPKLRAVRESRPKPGRDDKVLVAWNGLAIMALADAGRWLQEPRYVEAAREAGDFILRRCWKNSKLERGYRGSTPIGEGFLDDYALAGLAFVRLHAATGDAKWLEAAHDLTRAIIDGFYDPSAAAFMRTHKDSTGLPVRMADMDDNVLPSGGTAATLLVLEVAQLAGDTELFDIGFNVLGRCAGSAARRASGSGFLLQAIDHAAGPVREVVVAGAATDAETQALWAVVAPYTHARVLPVRIPAEGAGQLGGHFPALEGKIALRGKPTAYVCEQGRCQAPTSDPSELKAQLDTAFARTP